MSKCEDCLDDIEVVTGIRPDSAPRPADRNKAAERLLDLLLDDTKMRRGYDDKLQALDAALAEAAASARRDTVARVKRLATLVSNDYSDEERPMAEISLGDMFDILDFIAVEQPEDAHPHACDCVQCSLVL